MAENKEVKTEVVESTIVVVNGETFDLAAGGIAQIKRISNFAAFLKRYGIQAIRNSDFTEVSKTGQFEMLELVMKLIGALEDENALILLGKIVTNKDDQFVVDNFDLEWVIDGISVLLKTKAFTKVVNSFFGGRE